MTDDTSCDHAADADLVLRTRSGDTEAFGELWRRHHPSGIIVARSVTSSIDADELVRESFTRIHQAILKGGGPNGSFRAYLFTTIRNTAAAWGRGQRETPTDDLDAVTAPTATRHAAEEALDRGLTAQAFRSLPSRWQEVLWYSEIEQMKPAEIAPLLGMTAGAVSQLAARAREGLREAWIHAHVSAAPADSECRWSIDHLGAHSRGNLGARDRRRLEQHLDDCARCMIIAGEASNVSSRLALVLLPLVLGVTGASGYLAAVQGGGTPSVTLAAMPSSVVEGAVVAHGAAGSATSAGAGGSGSAVTGIGALIGAGSAALVVAGAIAAAAVVPGMITAAPATSQPRAADTDPSSISSEVTHDPSVFDEEPVVIEVDEKPKTDESETKTAPRATEPESDSPRAPAPSASPAPIPSPTESAPAASLPPADATSDQDRESGLAPSPDPTPSPDPSPSPNPDPPAPEPAALTWGAANIWVDRQGHTHFSIPVSGVPGATVQVRIDGVPARGSQVVLGADGKATADIRPNGVQLQRDAAVFLRMIAEGAPGEWVGTTLSGLGWTGTSPIGAGGASADE